MIAGAIIAAADPNHLGVVWYLPFAGVGALLVIRRPRTSIGWVLLGLAWAHAIVTIHVPATLDQFADGRFAVPEDLFVVVHNLSIGALFYLYLVLFTVFPSGGFAAGRWGRLARVVVAVGFVMVAAGGVMPMINTEVVGYPTSVAVRNPIAFLPQLPIWGLLTPDTAGMPVMLLALPAALSLIVRMRRSTGVERQQLHWIAASIGFVVLAVVAGFAISYVVPESVASGIAWRPAIVAFPTVPVAIGIAVLRYRLFEIDRIVSRTVAWALVTSALVAVFAGCVVGLQALLADVTNGETVAVAGATVVAAAAFQPIRRHLQTMVDHRFNRARYDAGRTTTAFGEQLRDQFDLASIRTDVATVVDVAFRPTGVGVWIRARTGR